MFVFAVDGLEWRVLKPLLEQGKLPVIAGLMNRGSYGYLSTIQPTYSAVVWTSIATGKMPDKHGIRHFVYPEERNGQKRYRYYTSGHRGAKAFWNILSDYGLTVDCIGWWMTYPAEPINGVMVSQTNTTGVLQNPQAALWKGSLLKGVEGQVYPPERQNRVMALLEEVDADLDRITEELFGRRPHPTDEFSQMMWDQTEWSFRADATYVRVGRDILEAKKPFDLFTIYLGGTDVSAHRFWRYAYPEQFLNPPDEKQIENFGRVIEDHYVWTDRTIGEFLALAPEDAAVVIVSDHGMHAVNTERVFKKDDPPLETTSAHHLDAPPGVIIAAGGPFVSSAPSGSTPENLDLASLPRVGSVVDVVPTILAAKGIPVGEDMDGAPLRGILDIARIPGSKIGYVATHDDPKWLASQRTRVRHAVDETERIEQLRSLGYIK
jgi:predicted AlkP superfamily phosphohydrolase/phosphomutase